jgi:Na+/proline symporter
MNPYISLIILIVYFAMLITVSVYTSRGADTNTFFTANRQSPWYLVAFGMIGTSLSGVTFISVPGAVANIQFSYFQVVIGYFWLPDYWYCFTAALLPSQPDFNLFLSGAAFWFLVL